jgi:divalent metal cation (Fe/Co/Zn/Cd) transporter
MRSEKRSAAGNSVLAASSSPASRLIVGFSTGSLGILSEAAHSGLDLIASLLTFFSVGVSDKPADADHQYGHGKIENFSAFVETGLLLRDLRLDHLRSRVATVLSPHRYRALDRCFCRDAVLDGA